MPWIKNLRQQEDRPKKGTTLFGPERMKWATIFGPEQMVMGRELGPFVRPDPEACIGQWRKRFPPFLLFFSPIFTPHAHSPRSSGSVQTLCCFSLLLSANPWLRPRRGCTRQENRSIRHQSSIPLRLILRLLSLLRPREVRRHFADLLVDRLSH